MRPKWSTVPSTIASHDSRCLTSPAMKWTRSPASSASSVCSAFARVATVDDDHRPLVQKPLRNPETDPSRPTGDTGNAPVEHSHDNPPRCVEPEPYTF